MASFACYGLDVSFQPPFYAICSQGSRLVLGEIVELCDVFAVPVIVREGDDLTTYLHYYESYHCILQGSGGCKLYCAYLSLPRFCLALRNSAVFARLVALCPLEISEPH